MSKIEDKVYALYTKLKNLFTTDDEILLGVCSDLSSKWNCPVALLRVVAVVAFYFYPIVTAIVYLVASLLLSSTDSSTEPPF